jgi:RNA polymerase sigma-70 factor (ECF subfamily)
MTTDAEVYEKHAEELTRFATALVGPSDAPDIVSTAVVNALSSSSWPTVENRRAYLYRCVLNAVRSGHRSTVRRERREVRVVERGVLEPPELRPEVLEAVRSLSDRQRAVVYLTYWDDLDPAAIASLLDIGEGSVKRHLARARDHLRRKLDD